MKHSFLLILSALLLLTACRPEAAVPTDAKPIGHQANIFPDYRDITLPPNIAPLNIMVREKGNAFVGAVRGADGTEILAAAAEDGKLMFDTLEWRKLLETNKGRELKVSLYAQTDEGWVAYPTYSLRVATEPIDPYLSYRLIEPGYEIYRQLGLYQRNITNFDVQTIYENNRDFDAEENHCANCHNYQNYSTDRMLFHVRAKHGGTVVIQNGKAQKFNMKSDSILSSTVYPSWHPRYNFVAFSSNQTGQAFHLRDTQKIEVIDYGSDLVFYDADSNTLSNILKTEDAFETFPCWSPDGLRLYYCVAQVPQMVGLETDDRINRTMHHYDSLHYNVMSLAFDPETHRFSDPRMEINCDSLGMSASVPRISPDGRYLLVTLGAFGQFHIWHNSADLYVKDLHTGELRALKNANSPVQDSYHTWSSNGRWMVFSSRRDDGSYTRPYIAYFDAQGRDHKAFMLPQQDPEQNLLLLKSYNVPELTKNAVPLSAEEITKTVVDDAAIKGVNYK